MAGTLAANQYPTLLDCIKALDPNGVPAAVVELMTQTNPVLQDAVALEGNTITGNQTTVRTSLPTASWRALNGYTDPSKSTVDQVTDTCGMIEAWHQMDAKEYQLKGGAAYAANETVAFLEALAQKAATAIFYADQSTDPAQFTGLQPRYNEYDATPVVNTLGYQIVNAGGDGTVGCAPVWFVNWGPNGTHLIYPKGSQAGISHSAWQSDVAVNSTGGLQEVKRQRWAWDIGLAIRNYKSVVRICNMDYDFAATGTEVITALVKAGNIFERFTAGGRKVIYTDRTLHTLLELQAMNKANVMLTIQEYGGAKILHFRGIPIRVVDALTSESAVSFT